MKIQHVWFEMDSGGEIAMAASSRGPGRRPNDHTFRIYPANAPSAIRFFEEFKAGERLDDDDARHVIKAAKHERATGQWKIVDMKIEPDDTGRDVLKTTLESGDLQVTADLWPPRTPSARLFLQSFQDGREFYDKDLRLLKKFIKAEADLVGLSPEYEHGILDWNPDWEEYL